MPVSSAAEPMQDVLVLVPRNAQVPFGIVTAKVEDTVRTALTLDTDSVKGNGVRGSAIINKQMAVVVDMAQIIDMVAQEMV
jgi:hypothetical protein